MSRRCCGRSCEFASRSPTRRLRIYGGTPPGNEGYLNDCVDLRDKLGLEESVAFEGRVRSIADAYLSGDVVVATSISEGFPYAVLEAMASGRAMIATDVGGVSEAIDDAASSCRRRRGQARRCLHQAACQSRAPAALANSGRERVRSRFMVELSNERYGELYDDSSTLPVAERTRT